MISMMLSSFLSLMLLVLLWSVLCVRKKLVCVRKDCMLISLSVLFVLTLVSSAVGVEDVHPMFTKKRQPDVSICDDLDLFVAVAIL